MTDSSYRGREPSGWAVTGVAFAACMLLMIGSFQIIAGLVAIIDDNFYVVARHYTFNLDTSGWGWIHLLLGLLFLCTGWALFTGKTSASPS
jgi:hypothetical protein